jgi:hypothetical protein
VTRIVRRSGQTFALATAATMALLTISGVRGLSTSGGGVAVQPPACTPALPNLPPICPPGPGDAPGCINWVQNNFDNCRGDPTDPNLCDPTYGDPSPSMCT